MNKYFILTASFIVAFVIPCRAEFSMPWISTMSNRVEAMGGAALGIDDESTELNLLNAGNPAGLVMKAKQNRFDLNAEYFNEESTSEDGKAVKNSFMSPSPGIYSNGINFWPLENLALSVQGEGQKLILNYPDSISTEGFGFSWYSGKISSAYKLGELSLGAEIDYFQLNTSGKPSYSDFQKYEMKLNYLGWHVGMGYQKEIVNSHVLSIGLAVGTDNRRPDLDKLDGTSPGTTSTNYNIVYNYVTTIEQIGIDPITLLPVSLGELEAIEKFEIKRKLFQTTGQVIYKIENSIQLGLILNYENESVFNDQELSINPPVSPSSQSNYKSSEYNGYGLTPIVKGNLALTDYMIFKYGIFYSNHGSYMQDEYSKLSSSATYKSAVIKAYGNNFALGIGCQSIDKSLSAACQFDQKRFYEKSQFYDQTGYIWKTSDAETARQQAFRFGAEYSLLDSLRLRGGYAYLLETFSPETWNNLEKQTTNRFSFGVGLIITSTLSGDVLGIYETYSQTPGVLSKHVKLTGVIGLKQIF